MHPPIKEDFFNKKSGKFKNSPLRLLIISVSYHLFLSALIAA